LAVDKPESEGNVPLIDVKSIGDAIIESAEVNGQAVIHENPYVIVAAEIKY
jgi:hypothetical protein